MKVEVTEIKKDTVVVKCAWCWHTIRDLRPWWKKMLRIKEKNRVAYTICDNCIREILSRRWDDYYSKEENRLKMN